MISKIQWKIVSNLFINYCFIDKKIISKNEGNKEGGNEDILADVKEGIDNDSNDSECYEEEKEFGGQPEEKKTPIKIKVKMIMTLN